MSWYYLITNVATDGCCRVCDPLDKSRVALVVQWRNGEGLMQGLWRNLRLLPSPNEMGEEYFEKLIDRCILCHPNDGIPTCDRD